MLPLPITWLGTKVNMRGVLLPLIASIPRKLYVEPFVGAGGLFFGKPQEAAEVINDRNRALVNLFKMMREPIVAADMQALLLQTAPCARSVYNELTQLSVAYLKGLDITEYKRAAKLADYSDEFAAAFAFFYAQNTAFAGGGYCKVSAAALRVRTRRALSAAMQGRGNVYPYTRNGLKLFVLRNWTRLNALENTIIQRRYSLSTRPTIARRAQSIG